MSMKFAIKRLTKSDLTFFEWQFRNKNAGNQKSINLNARVFIDQLYPGIPSLAPLTGNEIPVALNLFGPGLKGEHKVARKITKSTDSYKNWRLNGEFVHNPDDDTARYNVLEPGDIAVFAFSGEPKPDKVSVFLVSAHVVEDTRIHAALDKGIPWGTNQSMAVLDKSKLAELIATANPDSEHPIRALLLDPEYDEDLEDAVLGGEEGTARVLHRKAGNKLSPLELDKAIAAAKQTGRDGEELVHTMLLQQVYEGDLKTVEWNADENAISPYDFSVQTTSDETLYIEVKSTKGEFDRAFHISTTELGTAITDKPRYDLYRVYNLKDGRANIRISTDIKQFAELVMDGVSGLPDGVRPDAFSVKPDVLEWGEEIQTLIPEDEED